jgi:hypothetical protein
MENEGVQSQTVTLYAKTTDLPDRNGRNVGMVAKFFPPVNVTEMYFHGGNIHSRDRVTNSNTGMGIGSWVNQDSIMNSQSSMDGVDQCSFVVRLKN